MGISNEIKVTSITIDEVTIKRLSKDHTIAIPIRFDNDSCVTTAKKSAKKCAAFLQFLFCLLNQLLFQLIF